MKGLRYQLKSILHDKFCLMSFLLPVVVAAVLHFAGSIDFTALEEPYYFGILKEDSSMQISSWLEGYGTVIAYETLKEMTDAVNEPSTNLIGVRMDENRLKIILSGDEPDIFRRTADTLPTLYEQRNLPKKIQVPERPDVMAGFQDMLIVGTLIVAMFMGCTFNAMNIISEKEDGVAFINEILPMTRSQYLMQKITVGFVCGCLSSLLTACICFRLSVQNAVFMLALLVFSAFVAALIGLLIGRASDGLMVGMVYIKIVMLLFMAVPILSFLVNVSHPLFSAVCYLVPSQAAFEGIMGLSAGNGAAPMKDVFILLAHCIIWFLLYLSISKARRKHS